MSGTEGSDTTPPSGAREWWRAIEPIHAVTYFAPESRQALGGVGLRGFWMGYFAARVAPVGAVGPSTVIATFFNFHPSMVRRSIPDAWSFAEPAAVLAARRRARPRALRRLDPSVEERARHLVPPCWRVVERANGSGRVLFGANRDLGSPADPVEALWQACTCLREHRGDGHVAALTAAGLDGCQALVLFALSEHLPARMFQDDPGMVNDEWAEARTALEARGLVRGDGITPGGLELRRFLEQTTDELAAPPFAALPAGESAELLGLPPVGGRCRGCRRRHPVPQPDGASGARDGLRGRPEELRPRDWADRPRMGTAPRGGRSGHRPRPVPGSRTRRR